MYYTQKPENQFFLRAQIVFLPFTVKYGLQLTAGRASAWHQELGKYRNNEALNTWSVKMLLNQSLLTNGKKTIAVKQTLKYRPQIQTQTKGKGVLFLKIPFTSNC